MQSSKVLQAIAVTAELCGRVFSPPAAAVFASDLEGFPDDAVLAALARCRKEVKGVLTINDVVSRIDDGRPGVEEAWAMIPTDEMATVVWTEEMAMASSVSSRLIEDGDRIGARMAFKEAYTKMVSDARNEKRPVNWTPSLGGDVWGRQRVLEDAVRKNRLTLDHAILVIGESNAEAMIISLGVKNHPLLAPPSKEGLERIAALRLSFAKPEVDPS